MNLADTDFESEFSFKTSKSGGKGGQHVNKTESRVSLLFNVSETQLLTESQKQKIREFDRIQLNNSGIWQIDVEKERSQLRNKKIAINQFYKLLKLALKPKITRKATKPTKASKEKRLNQKKIQSEKKENRRKNF